MATATVTSEFSQSRMVRWLADKWLTTSEEWMVGRSNGWTITFPNGLRLSITVGKKFPEKLEVAVIGPDDEWVTQEVVGETTDGEVLSWVQPERLQQIVWDVQNYTITS